MGGLMSNPKALAALLGLGVAATPDDAEAMYVGPLAKGWKNLQGKFSSLADKMPRAEISDAGAEIIPHTFEKGTSKRLGDILDHPELYEQYPHTKDMPVWLQDSGGSSYGGGQIYWGPKFDGKLKSSSLLHEVQHDIQHKEGWARGGNAESFVSEALAKQDYLPGMIKDYSQKIPELENYINNEIRLGAGKHPYVVSKIQELNTMKSELPRLQKEYSDSLDISIGGGRDKYRRLAGEIEARDTTARRWLDPAQRSSTLPYASQNIPLRDTITKMSGGAGLMGAASLYSPEAAQARQSQDMASQQALQEPTFDPTTLLAGPARWGGGLMNMGADALIKLLGGK